PSATSPHLFVQDAAGGDFSAIRTSCSASSSSHPCTVASTVHTTQIGHKVTLTGLYIKGGLASGGTEDFYIETITDNGAGTLPTPASVMLADIERSSVSSIVGTPAMKPANAKYWYQRVTVSNPGTLVMYDLSPSELVFQNATKCSYQLGFGMAPMGTTPGTD